MTIADESKIPNQYADPLGVHVMLDAEQTLRVVNDIGEARRHSLISPDLFAPIAEIALGWTQGDPLGSIRVTYTYACTLADFGYEVVQLDADGHERVLTPPTGSTDASGQLCAPK